MSTENTTEDRTLTFTAPDKPFTVHATIGVYAKEPDVMRLKELSIRVAYATSEEMIGNTNVDMGAATALAVAGCLAAGAKVPQDMEQSPAMQAVVAAEANA